MSGITAVRLPGLLLFLLQKSCDAGTSKSVPLNGLISNVDHRLVRYILRRRRPSHCAPGYRLHSVRSLIAPLDSSATAAELGWS